MKRDISVFDFIICGLASLAAMALVWQDFNIKVFYFFTFALIASEILVRLRWRMKMICHICGFDPILYKKDPQRTALKVKSFLEARQTDPKMLLKPYPNLTPLKRRAKDPLLDSPILGSALSKVKPKASIAEKPVAISTDL